jgi:drug/metabolite transporter (DMT)-like permease
VAAACGVLGVVLIFWPEVVATGARPNAALGLGVGVLAVVMACIGNALTLSLTRRGVPLVPILGWGMTYGALLLLAIAAAQGSLGTVGRSAAWFASLLYLTLFGTVIAFFVYFRLAQRVGPARAAMTGVMIPPIALAISAALEGWRPTALSLAGVVMCLGSVFVATRTPGSAR